MACLLSAGHICSTWEHIVNIAQVTFNGDTDTQFFDDRPFGDSEKAFAHLSIWKAGDVNSSSGLDNVNRFSDTPPFSEWNGIILYPFRAVPPPGSSSPCLEGEAITLKRHLRLGHKRAHWLLPYLPFWDAWVKMICQVSLVGIPEYCGEVHLASNWVTRGPRKSSSAPVGSAAGSFLG